MIFVASNFCRILGSHAFPISNRETYDEGHFVYKIRATRVTHTQFKAVELEQKFGNSDSRMLLERHGIRIVSRACVRFPLLLIVSRSCSFKRAR